MSKLSLQWCCGCERVYIRVYSIPVCILLLAHFNFVYHVLPDVQYAREHEQTVEIVEGGL